MQMTCTYADEMWTKIWHVEKTSNTDYLANHLHDPEMEKFNIPATNSIQ